MPVFLFYNDQWLPENQPLITAGNRGFRFGDGLFETLCVVNGAIRLARYHFERLFAGLELLQLRLPAHYTPDFLSAQIITLCQKNSHPAARVRLTVFRGEGNLFDPPATPPGCIIQSLALSPAGSSSFTLHHSPLTTGIYPHARKAPDAFSHLKSNNCLPSVMAALYAREHKLNDVFLLNAAGRVCESAIANVFIIKNDRVFTPPLEEGCVAGVMRRFILGQLPACGFTVEETPLTTTALLEAGEVFLTNAIHLLRPVGRCDNAQYSTRLATELFHALEKKII